MTIQSYRAWLIAFLVGLPIAIATYYAAVFVGANSHLAGGISGGLGALTISLTERRLSRGSGAA